MVVPQFIQVVDFDKFQHYRDRTPPWIKLHRSILDDWRLLELPEADRWQLLGLYLLASECDNLIPYRPAWIKQRLSLTRPIALKTLIALKYVRLLEHDASGTEVESTLLAEPETSASPRARAESRVEKSREEESIYISHGEFGNCRLLAEEHEKLTLKLNGNLESYIQRFDRWIEEMKDPKTGLIPVKFRNRKAYLSILNWFERDGGPLLSGMAPTHPPPSPPSKPTEEQIAKETERYVKMGVIKK